MEFYRKHFAIFWLKNDHRISISDIAINLYLFNHENVIKVCLDFSEISMLLQIKFHPTVVERRTQKPEM